MDKNSKIVIPGAAGLVGQNLIVQLKDKGYTNIVALDKHEANLDILKKLHPDVTCVVVDLATSGDWDKHFIGANAVIMLQAQIGALTIEPFIRNNIDSTKNILKVIQNNANPHLVHISSSVVESKANDFYTQTKKQQEDIVLKSGVECCVLRPTLMFGWFDRKHLGWLGRFMEKTPIFPIPGHGKYMRQPLYENDFCKVIISAMERKITGKIHNITGREKIDYIDIIKTIKKVKNLKTAVVRIPYHLFYAMMWTYSLFSKNPPFTTQQLRALVADDCFELIPWWDIFDVEPTSFDDAMQETLNDPKYSKYILEF